MADAEAAVGADSRAAIWYWRNMGLCCEVYGSEEEAAHEAALMRREGSAAVDGVQTAGGRVVRCRNWQAYKAAVGRLDRQEEDALNRRASVPERARREVVSPFDGRHVLIEATMPEWVGKKP